MRRVVDQEGRVCICDGGCYEIKEFPFLVHPGCEIHGVTALPAAEVELENCRPLAVGETT